MQVQINRGYNPIICEANSVKTVSDYTLLAFLLLSECAINNYPAELRNAGVSSQWSGNIWLLLLSRTRLSPLSPHHRHNKFMNEKLSNEPDEERRAVTTCHPVITLIVNIQASELSTSLPCLSLAFSIIISFSLNATSVGVVFKRLIQVWLEDIWMHQLHVRLFATTFILNANYSRSCPWRP